jgi:hypothetical protein
MIFHGPFIGMYLLVPKIEIYSINFPNPRFSHNFRNRAIPCDFSEEFLLTQVTHERCRHLANPLHYARTAVARYRFRLAGLALASAYSPHRFGLRLYV